MSDDYYIKTCYIINIYSKKLIVKDMVSITKTFIQSRETSACSRLINWFDFFYN